MRCEQAQRALSDARYASGEDRGAAAADQALAAHLAECAVCRALQVQHAGLDQLLARVPNERPSADFDARFFSRLAQERARSRRRKRIGIAAAVLPIAAAVAIAVLRDRPSAPEPMILAQVPAGDVDLALDLDLVEELDVVEHLDEIEAYELLGDVDEAELERILKETP
jgi:hypothetical protein